MKTISFISQKGGTGKTTLALNIAAEGIRQGYKVVVLDLDPQPSAVAWSELRQEGTELPVLDTKASRLSAAAEVARAQGIDILILDTGGRTDEGAFAAAKVSDLVVVPLQPSAIDLKSMNATRELIERAGNPPALVVLTRVKPFGTRHDETRAWLETEGYVVTPTLIGDRVTFQDAYAGGMSAPEFDPTGRAAAEVRDLYMSICRHVDMKLSRDVNHESKTHKPRRAG